MRTRPLIIFAIGMILGVLLGHYIPAPFPVPEIIILLIAVIFFAMLFSRRKKYLTAILILGFAIAGWRGMARIEFFVPDHTHVAFYTDRGEVDLVGTVSKSERVGENRVSVDIDAKELELHQNEFIPVEGKVRVTLSNIFDQPRRGDRVKIIAELEKPRSRGNPGAVPSAWFLRTEGIFATAYIRAKSKFEILESASGSVFLFDDFRNKIRFLILTSTQYPASEVVRAIVLGESGQIAPAIWDAFRKTGTAHLLAVSGIHVGVIAAFAFWLCSMIINHFPKLLLAVHGTKVAAVLAIPATWFYAELAGNSTSVLRASIMATAYLVALIIGRPRDILSAIALACIAILFIDPSSIFHASFQLSFIAVLGIVIFTAPIIRWYSGREIDPLEKLTQSNVKESIIAWLILGVSSAGGAWLVTMPWISYHFNLISLLTVPVNLIAVPIFNIIILPFGLFGALISVLIPVVGQLALKISALAINALTALLIPISKIDFLAIRIPTPSVASMIIWNAAILLIALAIRKRFYRFPAIVVSIGAVLFIVWDIRPHNPDYARMVVIDVGQGQSILLEEKSGARALIDGGGSYGNSKIDIGESVVAKYLWKKGITSLDMVICTHPHPDHYGGLIYIINNFKVRKFIHPDLPAFESEGYEQLVSSVKNKNIPILVVDRNSKDMDLGAISLSFLHPPPEARDGLGPFGVASGNDQSLVILAEYGKFRIFLPADAQKMAEHEVISKYKNISSQVLMVPHHGSHSSSTQEFINAVAPQVAIISVGRYNMYKHPSPEVINRYDIAGIPLFRTDRDGQVVVEAGENYITVSNYFSPGSVLSLPLSNSY